MSEQSDAEQRIVPDSRFKWPRPFGNLTSASAYPPWKPVDTKKETSQIFNLPSTQRLVLMHGYTCGKEPHSRSGCQ